MPATEVFVPVLFVHAPGTTRVPVDMERVPAPVVVNAKLPVVKGPVLTKEKDPWAPKKVPVPEVIVAVPEIEVEDVGVTVALAVQVLPSPNVTTKARAIAPAPAAVPLAEMVVAP